MRRIVALTVENLLSRLQPDTKTPIAECTIVVPGIGVEAPESTKRPMGLQVPYLTASTFAAPRKFCT
jgi:hypothetical protein